MAEYSSLRNTFSTSRFAIMLPAVALRSPASTTPWSQVAATIVVPCGRSLTAWLPGPDSPAHGALPGRSPGECEPRKSANDELCRFMKLAGGRLGERPASPFGPTNGPVWLPSKYEPNANLLP